MNIKDQKIDLVLTPGGKLQIDVQALEPEQQKPAGTTITKNLSAEQLKTWRKSNSYTQSHLAELLGVKLAAVARWEQAANPVPPYLWLALIGLEIVEGK